MKIIKNKARLVILVLFIASCYGADAATLLRQGAKLTPPYSLKKGLTRAEELFKENNFRDALIFYYEAMEMVSSGEVKAKLHFRIGECLEAVKRYEFATFHYQQSVVSGRLPELLQSRAIMKLEHLPELAQTEEATRLYNRAMELYARRNLRAAVDDYLESLRLMPSLMERNDGGLLEDSIKYLTFLTESREREPERLLKLATVLELHGSVDKSVETLQQIIIIYPDTDQAKQAEEKLQRYASVSTAYIEPEAVPDGLGQVMVEETVFEESFEFSASGSVARDTGLVSFEFRCYNERAEIPPDRFEVFVIGLGQGGERQEFVFTSSDGINERQLKYETEEHLYTVSFASVDRTTGYIQDLYSDGRISVDLFSNIGLRLRVEKKIY